MKKLLIIFLCCGAAALCFADNPYIETKEQTLLKQEKELAKKMFELRVKLLKNDPEFKKLHEKIMELHKELALQLDNSKEMRALATKLRKVRNSLADIKKQKEED